LERNTIRHFYNLESFFMRFPSLFALILLICAFPTTSFASDQIPGAAQAQPIAIMGATIHTVSGDTIERGSILFESGKITAVGKDLQFPLETRLIEAGNKHIYPGLIEAYCDIGLVEINSIRATIDSREIGSINSNVRSIVAVNPDSELIPVARANGILSALTVPVGDLVAGQSSLIALDGWTRDDMALKEAVGLHVRWPSKSDERQELTAFIEQAKRYFVARDNAASGGQPLDLRLEAVAGVLDRSTAFVVDANDVDSIREAVAFAKKHSLRLIIHGGRDALVCSELLRSEKVPVIVSAVYRNPSFRHSAYDEAYSLPKRLSDAKIEFCISTGGRFGANGIRNLPYNAATAAAYGLSEEIALRAITLNPARILGVEDRIGSLQVGLDATLFVADGNILETPTNVELAYIQGRAVELTSRHTQLYEKYKQKYAR
jgi:imidazolonepropionase-like amidohydrolase